MIIQGNNNSGSSEAQAKLEPAKYRKPTLTLRIMKVTESVM
jgi:hypothetical protein